MVNGSSAPARMVRHRRAGRREFDFVNGVIGYRVRREVDVKPGQITAVSVTIPNGRLNINATSWASVW